MFHNFTKKIFDILFPLHCISCGISGTPLCRACQKKIKRLENNTCSFCGIISLGGITCQRCLAKHHLKQLVSFAPYDDPIIKKAIWKYKYDSLFELARPLSDLLIRIFFYSGLANNKETVLLVPVPMHFKKERIRGYNQAALLAQNISTKTGISLAEDLLTKQKNNQPQMQLPKKAARLRNVRGLFQINRESAWSKNTKLSIVLVDDVATTGATLDACATTLVKAGFTDVSGLTVARQHME